MRDAGRMRGRREPGITAPLCRNQKARGPYGAASLYEHVYTERWHTFKRLAKKICTFFAGGANWPCCATYAAGAMAMDAIEDFDARQPTLNNQSPCVAAASSRPPLCAGLARLSWSKARPRTCLDRRSPPGNNRNRCDSRLAAQ